MSDLPRRIDAVNPAHRRLRIWIEDARTLERIDAVVVADLDKGEITRAGQAPSGARLGACVTERRPFIVRHMHTREIIDRTA